MPLSDKQIQTFKSLIDFDLEDPNLEVNKEIYKIYSNAKNTKQIQDIISLLNLKAYELFFKQIIEDFNAEQKQKFDEFLKTNPTKEELVEVLLQGYKLKYSTPIKDKLLEIRKQVNQEFLAQSISQEILLEKINSMPKQEKQEFLENFNKGYILTALNSLIKQFD